MCVALNRQPGGDDAVCSDCPAVGSRLSPVHERHGDGRAQRRRVRHHFARCGGKQWRLAQRVASAASRAPHDALRRRGERGRLERVSRTRRRHLSALPPTRAMESHAYAHTYTCISFQWALTRSRGTAALTLATRRRERLVVVLAVESCGVDADVDNLDASRRLLLPV
ncbi:hypothetical protein PybrP1_011365 [[Pythium] brassicae (nom. inval.)]|nr:hypothetical protein PybrP1_011365 [[Pythium] brassicae (nom. inval.)]